MVVSWAAGFAGFVNCEGMKLPGVAATSSLAFAMAPAMPCAPSVSTSFAPKALMSRCRSTDMVSGMTMTVS